MALPAHSGPLPLIQLRNHFSQTVGLLGGVISPSHGRYLYIGQHKHRKRIHTTNIHALSGIRTHDPSVRARKTVHALDCTATVTGSQLRTALKDKTHMSVQTKLDSFFKHALLRSKQAKLLSSTVSMNKCIVFL
jgi:hypothetical protein